MIPISGNDKLSVTFLEVTAKINRKLLSNEIRTPKTENIIKQQTTIHIYEPSAIARLFDLFKHQQLLNKHQQK
jgi:hypothetical protein